MANKNTVKATNNVSVVASLIASLTDEQRNELGIALKSQEIKITARGEKAPKMYVAARYNTKDSSATAKKQRKAGTIEYLTATALEKTLDTWMKGAKNEPIRPIVESKLLAKEPFRHDFTNFSLLSIVDTSDISGLETTFTTVPATI